MIQWNRPKVFTRISKISSFYHNPLIEEKELKHIFMPWSGEGGNELMFKMKKMITDKGNCVVPFIGLSVEDQKLSNETFESIVSQIKHGNETHLVMSNKDSIHIYKISRLIKKSLSKNNKENYLDSFGDYNDYSFFIEVEDLFVHSANHSGGEKAIINCLNRLTLEPQRQSLFIPIQKLNVTEVKSDSALKWIEMNRTLTYDYFIRACELEENTYQEVWGELGKRSQHYLIIAEQLRHKGVLFKDEEKLTLLKESLESYLSALLNEVNEVYIRPLVEAFLDYESLQEAWRDIEGGLIQVELRDILSEIYYSKEKQVSSLKKFIVYMNTIKSCLFSFKYRFSKKIGKEEYLLIENFLSSQENMIESFLCKKLDKKINSLLEVKNWLKHVLLNLNKLDTTEINNSALKLSHILTIVSSTSYEDNIFYKLTEAKTSRGIIKRSFEDEVKALNKEYNKALAS
jgi:hypothetical protein